MAKTVICCVNVNNYCGRGAEYVNKLFDMVRRNLSEDFEGKFVCFTDDSSGLDEGIETQSLPQSVRGWHNKLYLFKGGLFEDGTQIIFFDLDTLICGDIDHLYNYRGRFAILRDFWRPDGLGPAVMSWQANKLNYVWESYEASGCPTVRTGDQGWLEMLYINPDILQDMFPDYYVSYKEHCQLGLPEKAKVVCFHGEPKNHNCESKWVEAFWKKGGLTKFDTLAIANVPDNIFARNIKHAITLPHEWLYPESEKNVPAIIVGGSYSLKNHLEEIAEMQRRGAVIFSMNNSHKYLWKNGIDADYHVMLDAREENIDFVPQTKLKAHLYASTCAPEVFEGAKSNVIIWHPAINGIKRLLENVKDKKIAIIGAGCNVGLKTMCIAYTMGYRKLFIFGFDSSYEKNAHHAYEQRLNDNERVLDVKVDDLTFRASPWMITQANEFQTLTAPELLKLGCELHVYGNGLLPYLAYRMAVAKGN